MKSNPKPKKTSADAWKADARKKFVNQQALLHFAFVTRARAAELRFMDLEPAALELDKMADGIVLSSFFRLE